MENEIKKFNHLMIDIETMGTASYSAIVSIAAVEFDIDTGETGNTFYCNVDLQSCLDVGLKTEVKNAMPFTGTPHNAIDDCLHQIKYCTAIWQTKIKQQCIKKSYKI